MANPSQNVPSAVPHKPLETKHTEKAEETETDYKNVVSSTVDNPPEETNLAVAGPSGSQYLGRRGAVSMTSVRIYDYKPKLRRRRKYEKQESSSYSSSSDEDVNLARIRAKKRALERAQKASAQAFLKRKRMEDDDVNS